ncbi:hypothetical protein GGI23_004584, partial [Coemansia sp. RSA 2559]
MLATRLVPARKHAFGIMVAASGLAWARVEHVAKDYHTASASVPPAAQSAWKAQNCQGPERRRSMSTPCTVSPKRTCKCKDEANAHGREVQRLVCQLRAAVSSSPGEAVRIYQALHDRIAADPRDRSEDRARSQATEKAPCHRDMRGLHVQIRRTAARLEDKGVRDGLLRVVVQIVEDMRWLGMRVGATEADACVYAHSRLSSHSAAVDMWQQCVAALGSTSSAPAQNAIKKLFPQTHRFALESAVASRNTQIVCKVYHGSIKAMKMAHSVDEAFFWCILNPRLEPPPLPPRTEAGRWRPEWLGSAFLTQMYHDVVRLAGHNGRLLNKTAQHLLRALFGEGHRQQAMQLYIEMRSPEGVYGQAIASSTDGLITPEILCEVVGGLCRHSRLEEAYRALVNADQAQRNIYVWNSYFDGLSDAIQRSRSCRGPDVGMREKLAVAIREMEAMDGTKPDTVTRTIWMRACFRSGDWHGGEACFRSNYTTMRSDVVCWDTCVRGLLESEDVHAVRRGWRLVGDLARRLDGEAESAMGGMDAVRLEGRDEGAMGGKGEGAIEDVDARFVETVLRHMLSRVSSRAWGFSPYDVLGRSEMARIFAWAEKNVSLDSSHVHGIIVSSLLDAGRIGDALDVHDAMRERGMWPPEPISCMLVRALALMHGLSRADEFIVAKVPRQQYAAAYFILLRIALQHREYATAWALVDKHYPEIALEADDDDAAYAPHASASSSSSRVYPSESMYNTFLRLTREHGDLGQHRLVLDRIKAHLGLIHQAHPAAAQRIAR